MNVPAKSKKMWTQLAHTLDEIAPGGEPNPPSEMITSIVEAIYDDYAKVNFANYQLRREDLDQLAAFARQFKDVHEFLSQLALISNVDAEAAPGQTNEKEAVNLSSVHQAKGLEFHTVFVIWLTDGMFPSSRSLDTRDALEEERRLFYVAITRARDELYLTYPHMRLSGGYGDVFQRPSRFLQEIPNDLVEDWQVSGGINDEARMSNAEGMTNDQMRNEVPCSERSRGIPWRNRMSNSAGSFDCASLRSG